MKHISISAIIFILLISGCKKSETPLPSLVGTKWQTYFTDDEGGHGYQKVYFGENGTGTLSSDPYSAGSNPNWTFYGYYSIPLTWKLENGTLFFDHGYIDSAAFYPYSMQGNYYKQGDKYIMKINGQSFYKL